MTQDVLRNVAHGPVAAHLPVAGDDAPVRVLVVNRDSQAASVLVAMLCDHGFLAEAVGVTALRNGAGGQDCDLVILDMMVCEDGGLAMLRMLTQRRHCPGVIMLSRHASEVDRIVALEMGADDCVAKPTSPREMLARVRSVVRRRSRTPPVAAVDIGEAGLDRDKRIAVARFAGWTFEVETRTLTSPAGAVVPLTNGEYGMLLRFVAQPRTVQSRERLAVASGKPAGGQRDRTIDVNVSRLRRKLADHTADELIRTVRSGGYLFMPVVACDPATNGGC
jgi:two-component system OmpR family response regulator